MNEVGLILYDFALISYAYRNQTYGHLPKKLIFLRRAYGRTLSETGQI